MVGAVLLRMDQLGCWMPVSAIEANFTPSFMLGLYPASLPAQRLRRLAGQSSMRDSSRPAGPRLSRAPGAIGSNVPIRGQDTSAVLCETRFSDQEIAKLAKAEAAA